MYLDDPNIQEADRISIERALTEGFVSTFGPYVGRFEEECGAFLKAKHVVAVQCGTAAIHMALREAVIGEGDEVIVPVATFVGSVNPILYVGATPVFVDIDRQTLNIDVGKIKEKITPRTKAILPVHLYGNPVAMDVVMAIAQQHGLVVIEDAAESLGAWLHGKATGTFGRFGCFSFNGNKVITTGNGGLVVSDDANAIEHIRLLINQAKARKNGVTDHPEIGYNYRMSNMNAALGIGQMQRIDEFLAKKKMFFEIYKNEFSNEERVSFQKEPQKAQSSYWLTVIDIKDDIDLAGLQAQLLERGVPTRRIWNPLVDFSPYRQYQTDDYPKATEAYQHCLCLPSSTKNTPEDIRHACRILKQALKHKKVLI